MKKSFSRLLRGILAVLLLAVCSIPLHAFRVTVGDLIYDFSSFEKNGIKYDFVKDEAGSPLCVTGYTGNNTSITIPENVSYSVKVTNRKNYTTNTELRTGRVTTIRSFKSDKVTHIKAFHIEEIGKEAFQYNKTITCVDWGDALKIIRKNAFEYCSKLFKDKSARFPKNLEVIEQGAFYCCSNFRGVNFQDCSKLKEIGAQAFGLCFDEIIEKYEIDGETYEKVIGYKGLESIIFHKGLEKIGNYAFYDCRNLKQPILIIPETVTEIGKGAFQQCLSLKEIKLNNASIIGDCVLYGCTNLKKVYMPNATNIPAGCFSGCENLSFIELPKSMEYHGNDINIAKTYGYVGEQAFYGCKNLPDKIDLPKGVHSVYELAFGYSNAYKVTYEGVKPIVHPLAFEESTGLLVPRNVSKAGKSSRASNSDSQGITMKYAYAWSKINEMPISDEIQKSAFVGCLHITTLRFPNNITEISESNVSQYIHDIYDDYDISDDFASIKEKYYQSYKDEGTFLNIYGKVYENIEGIYFDYCCGEFDERDEKGNLIQRELYHTVEFHPNVSRIAEKCLSKYPIKKVVFGYEPMDDQKSYSGMSIEANAFATNTDIDTVVAHFSEPPVLDDAAFPKSVYDNAMLIVPDDAVDLYRTTPGWKLFRHLSTSSGIDCVTVPTDESPRDVYNLDGILLIRNASDSDLLRLDRGLYIIGGKKVWLEN